MPSFRTWLVGAALLAGTPWLSRADVPSVSYIFPAGGQRGTAVEFRVGGHYLYEGAPFRMDGPGVAATDRIERTDTIWFEGPVIPQPASQAKENYPKDYRGRVVIAGDAPLGSRIWRTWNSQGVTPGMQFVVGDLPEIVEQEIDGQPVPTAVSLPVTINGRIFPREDIDVWTFEAKAGQVVTCEVNAARLGSDLDSRIEFRGPDGKPLAQNGDALGNDSLLRVRIPEDGRYAVHIYDEAFGGLQHYVYRLTLTAGPWIDHTFPLGGRRGATTSVELSGANLPAAPVDVAFPSDASRERFEFRLGSGAAASNAAYFELDDLPEFVEPRETPPPSGSAEIAPAAARTIEVPAVANGRIDFPRDVDLWTFQAAKGSAWEFDLKASRLGSSLDSVLTLLDAEGKTLGTNDDFAGGQTDSRLQWTAPQDGLYTLKVEERLASRGGGTLLAHFAYRLRIAPVASRPAGFRLTATVDAITVERGKTAPFKINVDRLGGFADEIELTVDGLPDGVTLAPVKVGKGQTNAQLTLAATATAKVQSRPVVVRGKAKIGEQEVTRSLTVPVVAGTPDTEQVFLSVAIPTPFKFAGAFETKFAPRGGVYTRRYRVERNGFDGPLEVSLADRQNRHLQGVTGPTIVVPEGATEFEYAVTMPPFMEIGRTSRSCLMAVGIVTDADGTRHKVSYSSEQQNDQIITLVDPARLGLSTSARTLRADAGTKAVVPVEVARGVGLAGPVAVSLVVPKHVRGVRCEPITLAADASRGELIVEFAVSDLGPLNMPLLLRGEIRDERGMPLTNETPIELVPAAAR